MMKELSLQNQALSKQGVLRHLVTGRTTVRKGRELVNRGTDSRQRGGVLGLIGRVSFEGIQLFF